MSKSVLIITPYFAPQTHAAVFRAHKLAKYLPDHGWKTYVLTVDTNYLYNEDSGLLDELPAAVEIVRSRYVEPTVRGLRMALGGKDRTFVAQKPTLLQKPQHTDKSTSTSNALHQIGSRVYTHAQHHWLQSPDAYWTWYRPAVAAGSRVIQQHGIDVIYSTAVPFTDHRIARELQKLGPKWVADFRDPVTYASKTSSAVDSVFRKQRDIVKDTLKNADAVTVLSSTYGLIFNDMYGSITKRPITFIPTGIDDALIPDALAKTGDQSANRHPYIIFVGEVMPDSTSEFFTILSNALQHTHTQYRLRVVGHELLNRSRLAPVLANTNLVDRVDFLDHLPQIELYQMIQGAEAGVLAPGPLSQWWTNHAKLVDYVGLRKPVLAVVPDPSEARSVLTRANLGVFLDGTSSRATQTLLDFLNGNSPPPEPIGEVCDEYLASSQVTSFVDVFNSLL